MNIDDQIKVMQAYRDGAEIEVKSRINGGDHWVAATKIPWNWASFDYRVKRKPKTMTLEWWKDYHGGIYIVEKDRKRSFEYRGLPEAFTLIKTETVEMNE